MFLCVKLLDAQMFLYETDNSCSVESRKLNNFK
jgi:hypothetical protein